MRFVIDKMDLHCLVDEQICLESAFDSEDAGEVFPSIHLRCSNWVHRVLAAILLIFAAPIILLLVLLVRLTSKGPPIFCQKRVGFRGRIFKVYKIRTMCHDAEFETGPIWTREKDPRITAIGRFLRSTHLDEFPQLLNVVMGQMNLIGPRPERPEFAQHLAREIPGYLNRLAVRPGITGLAQINLSPDTDIDSVRRKLILDLEYLETVNLSLDFRIFLCTLIRLLGVRGTLPSRILHLLRKPRLDADMKRPLNTSLLPDGTNQKTSYQERQSRTTPK